MGAMLICAVGITLLSLAAGLLLMNKSSKENLAAIYKVAAWFIIIISLLNLMGSVLVCMKSMYKKHHKYEMMMMHHKMEGKMHKKMMRENRWHHGYGRHGMEGDERHMKREHDECDMQQDRDECVKKCCKLQKDSVCEIEIRKTVR